jgi:ABC-type Zn uptake system ZnuABC Zn-binding protein ZnuA
MKNRTRSFGRRAALILVLLALAPGSPAAAPLRVVATVPDLADLARQIGGEEVAVTALAKGPQDAHFIEARPSFVRALHEADVFLLMGMDLEIGWAPVLLRSARNGRIQPGTPGYLDASTAIQPLETPTTTVTRAMGDVHPYGNPHFLTDPLNGLRVARLIRDRFAELRPEAAAELDRRYQAFARRLAAALAGEALASRHPPELLAAIVAEGRLAGFLAERGETAELAGWLGALRGHPHIKAVQDHRLWPYFGARFGIDPIETLEPLPGIAPTTRHLTQVVERMRAEAVRVILASPYFDPRHARWVAQQTGAKVAEMAHQVGARAGTDDYLAMIDHNVKAVLGAL